MKQIATLVDDTTKQLAEQVAQARSHPGRALPAYFYRSHVAYQHELDAILYRSWLYAAHISEIPNPGDFVQFELGEDALIITRDDSGEVRALMNVCRHRGARVCEASSGHARTFVCPYHGWVYGTDGSLRGARDMDRLDGFDPSAFSLKQAQVAVYMGLIFINCDPEAPDFMEPLSALDRPLGAYHLDQAKVAHKQSYRVDANWKLALENYLECYHCATAHRNYARMHTLKEQAHKVALINASMMARAEQVTGVPGITDSPQFIYSKAPAHGACVYHSRYALYDGYLTGSEDGQPVAPLMGRIQGFDGGAGDYQMGPLTFMLNYPDHCVLYRFIPRGLTATDMEIVWYVNGDAVEGKDYDTERVSWLWHTTTLEDEYIIMRNSEGVNSRFFEPGPYHPDFEATSMAFVEWYLQTMADSAGASA